MHTIANKGENPLDTRTMYSVTRDCTMNCLKVTFMKKIDPEKCLAKILAASLKIGASLRWPSILSTTTSLSTRLKA